MKNSDEKKRDSFLVRGNCLTSDGGCRVTLAYYFTAKSRKNIGFRLCMRDLKNDKLF